LLPNATATEEGVLGLDSLYLQSFATTNWGRLRFRKRSIKDLLFVDDIAYDQYDFIFCDNEKPLVMSFTHDFHFDIFHHE